MLKKWTQTRDSWMKATKKHKDQKASGASAKPSRLYIYHEQMSFLKKITNFSVAHESTEDGDVHLRTESTDVTDEEGIALGQDRTTESNADATQRESFPQPASKPGSSEQRKRQFPVRNVVDAKMMKFIDHQMNTPKEQEDRHTSFFKSISPTLSLLTDDQTLQFQAGVIKLLQDIKSKTITSNDSSPTQRQKDNWYVQEWATGKAPLSVNPSPSLRQQDSWNNQGWSNHASTMSQQEFNTNNAPPSRSFTLINSRTVLTPQQSPESPVSLETQNSGYSYTPDFSH